MDNNSEYIDDPSLREGNARRGRFFSPSPATSAPYPYGQSSTPASSFVGRGVGALDLNSAAEDSLDDMSFMDILGASSRDPVHGAEDNGGSSESILPVGSRGGRGGRGSRSADAGRVPAAGRGVRAGQTDPVGRVAPSGRGGRDDAALLPAQAQPYRAPRPSGQTSRSTNANATAGRGRGRGRGGRASASDVYAAGAEEGDEVEEVAGSGSQVTFFACPDRLLCCY